MAFNRSLFRRRRRGGGSLSNLIVWLDGSDGSTLQGDPIEVWQDKSGYANDAYQSTPANQPSVGAWPLNANSCVNFATGNYLDIANTIPIQLLDNFTLFTVSSMNVMASTNIIYCINSEWYHKHPCDGASFSAVFEGDAGGLVSASADSVACISVVVNSGTISLYVNGSLVGTDSPLSGTFVGSTYVGLLCDGYIGEIMLYNIPLDNAFRSDVESALMSKWSFP